MRATTRTHGFIVHTAPLQRRGVADWAHGNTDGIWVPRQARDSARIDGSMPTNGTPGVVEAVGGWTDAFRGQQRTAVGCRCWGAG